MAQWLITGGCGFIGGRLVRSLLADREHRVRVLDDLSVGRPDNLGGARCVRVDAEGLRPTFDPQAIELLVGSILDRQLVERAAKGADVLVHLAASSGVPPSIEDPVRDCHHNVLGTLYCLEAARAAGTGRFLFASSGAPLGEAEPPLTEETLPRPLSPYGASKLAGEAYCAVYHRTFGLGTTALRFANAYGPGSGHKTSVVARFIRQALAGQGIEIHGDGEQTRDFIYVDDLVRALRLAATAEGVAGETLHIAADRETSILELIEALQAALISAGLPAPTTSLAVPRVGDVRRSRASASKARRLLGWQSETGLEEGLAATVGWFLDGASRHSG